jgi:predicted nucleic acid-binding protein
MRRSLCLDTSIFSRLVEPASSTKRRITELFLQAARRRYRLLVSPAAIEEMEETQPASLKEELLERTWETGAEVLPYLPDAEKIARELMAARRWSEGRIVDMVHLAYTVLADADALVAWDERHLAHERTRVIVHALARRLGLPAPLIGTPLEVASWLDIKIASQRR